MNEPIFPKRPIFQEAPGNKPLRLIPNSGRVLRDAMSDKHRLQMVEYLLGSVEFKGTIHQIRELVNDPKWDDKV